MRTLFILAFTAVVSASCGTASLSANRTVTPTLTPRLATPLPTLPAVFVPAGAHPRHTALRRQHRLLLPAGP